jgi:hypothetical protein
MMMGSWPPILGGCRSPEHLRRVAWRGAAEKVTPALSAAGSPDPPGPARLEPDERTLRRIFKRTGLTGQAVGESALPVFCRPKRRGATSCGPGTR